MQKVVIFEWPGSRGMGSYKQKLLNFVRFFGDICWKGWVNRDEFWNGLPFAATTLYQKGNGFHNLIKNYGFSHFLIFFITYNLLATVQGTNNTQHPSSSQHLGGCAAYVEYPYVKHLWHFLATVSDGLVYKKTNNIFYCRSFFCTLQMYELPRCFQFIFCSYFDLLFPVPTGTWGRQQGPPLLSVTS